MLRLYVVKVWRTNEPQLRDHLGPHVYCTPRATPLIESYPGCNADTLGVLIEGTWAYRA